MRNCLVLVFSVWSIYLSARGLKLAHSGVEIVQNTSSLCPPSSSSLSSSSPSSSSSSSSSSSFSASSFSNGNKTNFSAAGEVHGRNKRYLLFEKGAAVSVTTAVVKAILPGIPRGFNIICEESLYYDLPSSLFSPKKDLKKPDKAKPTKLPPRQKQQQQQHQQQKQEFMTEEGFQNFEIPNYHDEDLDDFQNYFYNMPTHPHTYEFPMHNFLPMSDDHFKRRSHRSAADSTYHTDHEDDNKNSFPQSLDIESIFFDQVESFAKRLGFNPRYCIMRTICESQHILFEKGQSLFHDVIRMVIKFSMPNIRKNEKYLRAYNTEYLMDCANLYGPHCKISFIDFFTYKIYGDDVL